MAQRGGKQKARTADEALQEARRLASLPEVQRAVKDYRVRVALVELLRPTETERRSAVETLLRDPERSQWSNNEIGRQCGVSKTFVGDIREELTGERAPGQVIARRGGGKYSYNTASNKARSRPTAKEKRPVGRPPKEHENSIFLDAAGEAVRALYKPGTSIAPPVSADIVAWLAEKKQLHMQRDSFRKKVSRLSKQTFEDWLADAIRQGTGRIPKPSRVGTK